MYALIKNLHYAAADEAVYGSFSDPAAGKKTLSDYYFMMSEDLNGIAVVSENTLYSAGNSYFSRDLIGSEIYENIITSNEDEVIFNRFPGGSKGAPQIVSIGIKLDSGNAKGVLIADIKIALFVKHFGMSNMDGIFRTVLTENNEKIIFSDERNLPHSSINDLMQYVPENNLYNTFFDIELGGEKYTATAKKLAIYPQWENITFFPKGSLYRSYYETLYSVIWIIAVVVALTVAFMLLILTAVTKKFKQLIKYTENIDLKNVHKVAPMTQSAASDEIDFIADKIYSMVSTLSEQINLISDIEEKKHLYEMQALKAQINPHFIYNSLNVIQTLADTQKNTRISEIANALSSLLRYSATNTDGFVTLGDEIGHITNYITIMQNKFLNKINLIIDAEPEIYGCAMLKMCLQPIVENSVRHGLVNSSDNYIMIKAYTDEDTVTVKIIDNGVGIEPEKLGALLDFSDNQSEHLGLKNVDRRIKLTFGSEYGIDIFSTPNVQTVVSVTIPYFEKGDLENE